MQNAAPLTFILKQAHQRAAVGTDELIRPAVPLAVFLPKAGKMAVQGAVIIFPAALPKRQAHPEADDPLHPRVKAVIQQGLAVALKGRQQLLRLIREALFYKPQNEGTNLNACLEQIGQMIKKKAIVCLISDFIHSKDDVPTKTIKTLSRLNQHHDLICFRVEDPRERTLPDVGFIALEDAETHETFYLNTHSESLRKKFAERQTKACNEFQNLCQKQGIEYLNLISGQPYITALEKLFKQRNRN